MQFQFTPIGYIHSCYKDRFGTPRQPHLAPDSWAVLKLRPEFNLREALDGLEGFSHLWLIFVFHRNTNRTVKAKVHPPRLGGAKIGVFSTRSPHRPNPIGLSAVRLERIEGNELFLSGVDLIEGTPVLDIKPYLPAADSHPEARGGWADERADTRMPVSFAPEALASLETWLDRLGRGPEHLERLKRLIVQTIQLDPRANCYKGTPDEPHPYTDAYGFLLEDFNIVFQLVDDGALVVAADPWTL
jgi:tRNA-Thr(GGU) m(6)t(6)A37 methyltransferase TsaA